jgi:hypothetical protein
MRGRETGPQQSPTNPKSLCRHLKPWQDLGRNLKQYGSVDEALRVYLDYPVPDNTHSHTLQVIDTSAHTPIALSPAQ